MRSTKHFFNNILLISCSVLFLSTVSTRAMNKPQTESPKALVENFINTLESLFTGISYDKKYGFYNFDGTWFLKPLENIYDTYKKTDLTDAKDKQASSYRQKMEIAFEKISELKEEYKEQKNPFLKPLKEEPKTWDTFITKMLKKIIPIYKQQEVKQRTSNAPQDNPMPFRDLKFRLLALRNKLLDVEKAMLESKKIIFAKPSKEEIISEKKEGGEEETTKVNKGHTPRDIDFVALVVLRYHFIHPIEAFLFSEHTQTSGFWAKINRFFYSISIFRIGRAIYDRFWRLLPTLSPEQIKTAYTQLLQETEIEEKKEIEIKYQKIFFLNFSINECKKFLKKEHPQSSDITQMVANFIKLLLPIKSGVFGYPKTVPTNELDDIKTTLRFFYSDKSIYYEENLKTLSLISHLPVIAGLLYRNYPIIPNTNVKTFTSFKKDIEKLKDAFLKRKAYFHNNDENSEIALTLLERRIFAFIERVVKDSFREGVSKDSTLAAYALASIFPGAVEFKKNDEPIKDLTVFEEYTKKGLEKNKISLKLKDKDEKTYTVTFTTTEEDIEKEEIKEEGEEKKIEKKQDVFYSMTFISDKYMNDFIKQHITGEKESIKEETIIKEEKEIEKK